MRAENENGAAGKRLATNSAIVLSFVVALEFVIMISPFALVFSAAKSEFMIALLVGLMAGGLPYGYVAGLLAGTALYYLTRGGRLRLGHE